MMAAAPQIEVTEGPRTRKELDELIANGKTAKLEITERRGTKVLSSRDHKVMISTVIGKGGTVKLTGRIFRKKEGSRNFAWFAFKSTYDIETRSGPIEISPRAIEDN